jgi:hypothetical protein
MEQCEGHAEAEKTLTDAGLARRLYLKNRRRNLHRLFDRRLFAGELFFSRKPIDLRGVVRTASEAPKVVREVANRKMIRFSACLYRLVGFPNCFPYSTSSRVSYW